MDAGLAGRPEVVAPPQVVVAASVVIFEVEKEFCWAELPMIVLPMDPWLTSMPDLVPVATLPRTSLPVLPASIKMPSVLLVSLTPRTFPLPLQSGTAPKSGPEVQSDSAAWSPASHDETASAFELRSAEAAKRWRGWDQWIGLPELDRSSPCSQPG